MLNPGLGGVLVTNGSCCLLATKARILNPGFGGVLGINGSVTRFAMAAFPINLILTRCIKFNIKQILLCSIQFVLYGMNFIFISRTCR